MKVNHMNSTLPRNRRLLDMGARKVEVAEVKVLVEVAALMQKASEAGHFTGNAELPAPKHIRRELPGREWDRLMQRQHARQFLDGEHALQFATRSDELAAGDD